MAWGDWTSGYSNNARVAITLSLSGSTITEKYYVQFQYFANDNMTLRITGSRSETIDFRYNQSGGSMLVATRTRSASLGSTYTYTAKLSGVYNGASPSFTYSITRPAEAPGAPGRPSVSNITSSGVRAAWAAAPTNGAPVDDYQVRVDRGGSTVLVDNTGTARNKTWSSGLDRATRYGVRVRAHSTPGGWGGYSSYRYFDTDPERPTISGSYKAANITRNSATTSNLSNTDNGGEACTNVAVQYNTSASSSGASYKTAGTWSNITMTGLAANTKYYFRMRTWNSAGWSNYGPWRNFTTLDSAPDDMADPTIGSITDTSFKLSWSAPNMNGATFSNYYWQVAKNSTFTTGLKTGSTTSLSANITGLTPGTKYWARVRANASPNNGGYGVSSATTTGMLPNSGLRVYAFIGGVRKQGDLYTFINGTRKKLKTMYVHDGIVETE